MQTMFSPTRARVIFYVCLAAACALFVACGGAANQLPTPNADQSLAQTMIAQGTSASYLGTKVARPEFTNTPGGDQAATEESGGAKVNPTRAARQTRVAAQTKPAPQAKATKPPAEQPTEPPEGFEPTATPPALPAKKSAHLNSPEYSIQIFGWYRPEIADRDMKEIKEMGFGWVKQQFAWRDIEGAEKGAFDWSRADEVVYRANIEGLDLLARMDNAPDWAAPGCFDPSQSAMGPARNLKDWTDFLTAFVTRYKGRVRAYQIWNEPNLAREWCKRPPNPEEYARLLKASYQTIKSIDPNALVISAGLTPTTADFDQAMPDMKFFGRMYDAMGNNSDGYFDLLGVHAAGFKADPEADPGVVAQDAALTNNDPSPTEAKRIYSFRHVEDVRKLMQERGDADKQIAILEFGWTSDQVNPAYSWFRVSEEEKANRIVRAFQYAKENWSPWIGVMSLIYMANADWSGNEEQFWWAITNPDGSPRPAYNALKAMPK
ncbi:MAG: hypothetical protein EYC68_17120 [Chloroflexota bacterium]|nr:MAG: hypothetical protein EYC68_17120 [Chloroflexota bacterium]